MRYLVQEEVSGVDFAVPNRSATDLRSGPAIRRVSSDGR